MNRKLNIYAMIPARFGSTRLKLKNMALINSKPMISYSIDAALESNIFKKVVVNSDHSVFKDIADRHGVDFYLRPPDLASSVAKSDSVVFDFIVKYPEADIVVWVNPIAPLQNAKDIDEVVNYFIANNYDSLISTEKKQVHSMYLGEPVNFKINESFSQTQDIEPIEIFSYSLMMWKSKEFAKEFKEKGFGLFCGNFGTKDSGKLAGFIIKTDEDLFIADAILRGNALGKTAQKVQYDDVAHKYLI